MQNMRKLKEDALRRKQEFEEKQRIEELQKQRKMGGGRPRPRPDRRRPSGQTRTSQQANRRSQPAPQPRQMARKKARKTPARWVLDTLLVVGALIVLVVLFNPY